MRILDCCFEHVTDRSRVGGLPRPGRLLGIESWVDSGVLRVNGFGVVGVVEVFAERVAGIDIGKATLKACVSCPVVSGHLIIGI